MDIINKPLDVSTWKACDIGSRQELVTVVSSNQLYQCVTVHLLWTDSYTHEFKCAVTEGGVRYDFYMKCVGNSIGRLDGLSTWNGYLVYCRDTYDYLTLKQLQTILFEPYSNPKRFNEI